jgi:hypothetical protein
MSISRYKQKKKEEKNKKNASTLGPRGFVDAGGDPLATTRRERSTERPLYYSAFISLFTSAGLHVRAGRRPLYYTACISPFTTARRVVLAARRWRRSALMRSRMLTYADELRRMLAGRR